MLTFPNLSYAPQLPLEGNLPFSSSSQESLNVFFKGIYIWPQETQHLGLSLKQLLSPYEGEQKQRHHTIPRSHLPRSPLNFLPRAVVRLSHGENSVSLGGEISQR